MEPLSLIVGLAFPHVGNRKLPPVSTFGFCSVYLTPEYVESEVTHAPQTPVVPTETPVASPEEKADVVENTPLALQDKDVSEILADEPVVLGDKPQVLGEAPSAAPRVVSVEPVVVSPSSGPSPELEARMQELNTQLHRLQEVNTALAHDVRRLMKERRQPTTDRELRDAVTELQERLKKLMLDRQKLKDERDERDKQIELLKTQVETLRQKKIA
jgi:hypothetical protein